MADEPFTLDNALDVLRSWSWLYDELRRSEPVDQAATDRHAAEGAAKGRLRQCSIGWHEECSDRSGINWRGECQCPCHQASMEGIGRFMRWMDECLSSLAHPGRPANGFGWGERVEYRGPAIHLRGMKGTTAPPPDGFSPRWYALVLWDDGEVSTELQRHLTVPGKAS